MVFLCPQGVLDFEDATIQGKYLLVCLPDNPEDHARLPFESTPLMSHFMLDKSEPLFLRIAEFAHVLEMQKARLEQERRQAEEDRGKENQEMVVGQGQVMTIGDRRSEGAVTSQGETTAPTQPTVLNANTTPPTKPRTPFAELPPIATIDQERASTAANPTILDLEAPAQIAVQAAGVVQRVPSIVIHPPEEQETYLAYPQTPPSNDSTEDMDISAPMTPPYEEDSEEEVDQLPGELPTLPEVPVPAEAEIPGRYDLRPRLVIVPEERAGGRVYAVKRKLVAEGAERSKKRKPTPKPETVLENVVIPAHRDRIARILDVPTRRWNNRDIGAMRNMLQALGNAVDAQKAMEML